MSTFDQQTIDLANELRERAEWIERPDMWPDNATEAALLRRAAAEIDALAKTIRCLLTHEQKQNPNGESKPYREAFALLTRLGLHDADSILKETTP